MVSKQSDTGTPADLKLIWIFGVVRGRRILEKRVRPVAQHNTVQYNTIQCSAVFSSIKIGFYDMEIGPLRVFGEYQVRCTRDTR
jgi:hypothetical protein